MAARAGAETDHPFDRQNDNLAVAEITRTESSHNGVCYLFQVIVLDRDLDFNLRRIFDVLSASIFLDRALLAAGALLLQKLSCDGSFLSPGPL